MDSFILSRVNLWDSINQNYISRVSFKLMKVSKDNLNYDHASNRYYLIREYNENDSTDILKLVSDILANEFNIAIDFNYRAPYFIGYKKPL